MTDLRFDQFETFVARGRRAQAEVDHLLVHGPGLTFAELAVGELFDWAAPIPRGPEPMVKTSATGHAWSRGYGTAEAFYRVERVAVARLVETT